MVFIIIFLISCTETPGPTVSPKASIPSTAAPAPTYSYKIIRSYPHDTAAFTEGLVFDDGFLYESTGLKGRSSLRKMDLETGQILHEYDLPPQYFGEGVTIYRDDIIQLTWQSQRGFVYDKSTFAILHDFTYDTEGWGLTQDGSRLIMSDGTASLHFIDPQTFKDVSVIQVHDNNVSVSDLNELEYINGSVYANVWKTDQIAIIDPQDGHVKAWIDLTGLLKPQDYSGEVDVLNGIAYDSQADRLFVTGKLWPLLFHIDLVGPLSTSNN